MTIFRWIFALLVVGLVGMATLQSLKPRTAPPTQVQLAEVKRASVTRQVSAGGKL